MSRVVVVTGSASGIGRATAARLESAGERVIGIDLRDAEVEADLGTPEGRAGAVAALEERGTLDAVVCCAGVEAKGDVTVRVNYFGVVELLEGLQPRLAASVAPRAVVVASFAAIHPAFDPELVEACLAGDELRAVAACEAALAADPPRSVYASSKRALVRWVRRTAPSERWAGAGIPLNAVAPGVVATPMTQRRLDDPERRSALLGVVPMPLHGPGEPEHVAALLAWLTGPENVLVTGQVVFADGGADAVLRGEGEWLDVSVTLDRLGIGLWTLQSSATRPGNPTALYRRFAEAAVLAEQLGFHSVWAAEHRLWYDGFCPQLLHAQAFVAARTTRLRLGQAMLIGAQHDPAALARNAATLQELSGGRLELGLGLGHRDAEFDALGLRRDRRGRLFEPVLDAVEGVGARLWLGGMTTPTLERAARRDAGLMLPQSLLPSELGSLLAEFRELGGTGAIGILRDVWVEPDPELAERARERVVAHYVEEAGAWWVLKGTVGFGNPAQLERQRARILRTVAIGTPEEVAAHLRADVEAGVELHCLRLAYDFTGQDELHEQLERVAHHVAPLLAGGAA